MSCTPTILDISNGKLRPTPFWFSREFITESGGGGGGVISLFIPSEIVVGFLRRSDPLKDFSFRRILY